MVNRKKTIEYNNDTENYSIEQRTTVNLTPFDSWPIRQLPAHAMDRHPLAAVYPLLSNVLNAEHALLQFQVCDAVEGRG